MVGQAAGSVAIAGIQPGAPGLVFKDAWLSFCEIFIKLSPLFNWRFFHGLDGGLASQKALVGFHPAIGQDDFLALPEFQRIRVKLFDICQIGCFLLKFSIVFFKEIQIIFRPMQAANGKSNVAARRRPVSLVVKEVGVFLVHLAEVADRQGLVAVVFFIFF